MASKYGTTAASSSLLSTTKRTSSILASSLGGGSLLGSKLGKKTTAASPSRTQPQVQQQKRPAAGSAADAPQKRPSSEEDDQPMPDYSGIFRDLSAPEEDASGAAFGKSAKREAREEAEAARRALRRKKELLVSAASTSLTAGAALEDPANATRRELTRMAAEVASDGDGEFVLKVGTTTLAFFLSFTFPLSLVIFPYFQCLGLPIHCRLGFLKLSYVSFLNLEEQTFFRRFFGRCFSPVKLFEL